MKTLVFFIPSDAKHPPAAFEDLALCTGGILRFIYYDEIKPPSWLFRMRIRPLIKKASVFSDSFAKHIRGEKVYSGGHRIMMRNIKEITFAALAASKQKSLVVAAANISDIESLDEIIRTVKDIQFLTTPDMLPAFETLMLEEYGIAGNVCSAAAVGGKVAVIMPGAEKFSFQGAEQIINFSKADIKMRCIDAATIRFKTPKVFKGSGAVLKKADALETALSFFGFDYSYAKVSSLKGNK